MVGRLGWAACLTIPAGEPWNTNASRYTTAKYKNWLLLLKEKKSMNMSTNKSNEKQGQLPLGHVIKWVAVSERLPELSVETDYGKTTKAILCLHSNGHMESCNLNEGIDEGSTPYWSYEQDGELCETVTHWADV